MGREIRKVPPGWEHPKDDKGHYKPLFDESYDEAAKEWLKECMDFKPTEDCKYYWEWTDNPPDKEYYRPEFEKEPTHYQIYETVSEGTPTSPVFESKEQLIRWLITEGYSESAAVNFAKEGWAPSFSMKVAEDGVKTIKDNIHVLEDD